MKRFTMLLCALAVVTTAPAAGAQSEILEVRPFVGAYVPLGTQGDVFKSSALFGVQGAVEITRTFHLLGTFSWSPAHDKYTGFDENVSIWAYDLGAELGTSRTLGSMWELKPYAGLGLGARSYVYKSTNLTDQSCTAGYGALGTELQHSTLAFRVEARANVFCYRSPIAGVASKTRNDLGLTFGLAYHFR